jgi:formimidoylglutamate deiminase
MTPRQLHAAHALLPSGWARNVLLRWNEQGLITRVETGVEPAGITHKTTGPLLPGVPNLHSHAFQRGFAGLTEYRSAQAGAACTDSFWSWRTLMYRFANQLTPEWLEAIATWAYAEMLEAGYTAVCEFHYVHHQADGQPYANDATLSRCLLRAAARVGLGITLLPVLYQTAGFGGQSPQPGQRRFLRSTDNLLQLLQGLMAEAGPTVRIGMAPHSLRAVPPDSLQAAVQGLTAMDASAPIHIHIAEQTLEVDDCLAATGQRPVQWLLDHAPVDARWCLVHATHMTPGEAARAAHTQAVAGLCPSTEANLGDGLFDLPHWRDAGGVWGVGSDSHATINAAEELMLLEYGQRLQRRQRNVLATPSQPHVATAMLLQAVAGGAQAAARPIAGLAVGQRADMVSLDEHHLALAGLGPQDMLSAHVFGSQRSSAISGVWTGGEQRVQAGRHGLHGEAAAGFIQARSALLAQA